jgi:murein DD-endopeptidase MepM/ murein hydrolase activator NlpD
VRQTWFAEPFVWPVEGRISGVYGSQRFYNGEPRRPHFGIDIAAPRKTPVRAPASGRVSLAETDMYFEGGLIFIDHGLSVTSVFMHLDSVHVAVGDIVQQGDVIGRVGSTGRSTGPHLDWRMYWQQQRVDPALLVPPMTAKASTASTGKKP